MSTLRRLLLLTSLGLALACACNETLPGDRCESSADCDPPLLCSNETAPAGTLGICVHPEAVPDAAIPEVDAAPDAAPTQDAST